MPRIALSVSHRDIIRTELWGFNPYAVRNYGNKIVPFQRRLSEIQLLPEREITHDVLKSTLIKIRSHYGIADYSLRDIGDKIRKSVDEYRNLELNSALHRYLPEIGDHINDISFGVVFLKDKNRIDYYRRADDEIDRILRNVAFVADEPHILPKRKLF